MVPENIHTPTTEEIGNSKGVEEVGGGGDGWSEALEIAEGRGGRWVHKNHFARGELRTMYENCYLVLR